MKPKIPKTPKGYRMINVGAIRQFKDMFPLGGEWCCIWGDIGVPYTATLISKFGPYIRKVTRK